MTHEVHDLSGVRILAPDQDNMGMFNVLMLALNSGYDEIMDADKDILDLARDAGAEIVVDEEGDPDFHREMLADPNTYTFNSSRALCAERLAPMLTKGSDVKFSEKIAYPVWQRTGGIALPIVLGSREDNGMGKYLLEEQWQVDRFEALDKFYSGQPLSPFYDVSSFITSPSDHYTSYRLVVSAANEIIAAGLLYSAHTETDNKRVTVAPRRDFGLAGSIKRHALEDPTNPYFLNARDIRSNVDQGGSSIPLLGGDFTRRVTPLEEDILAEHGIMPFDVDIPPELRELAIKVSNYLDKAFGLVIGLDFIQDAETDDFVFLEANSGPGPRTYIDCWLHGDRSISTADGYRALMGRTLASISAAKLAKDSLPKSKLN